MGTVMTSGTCIAREMEELVCSWDSKSAGKMEIV